MSKPTTHQVVSGDTLSALAKKYGTTVQELKSLNGLKSDLIKVGQILKLVKDTPTTTQTVSIAKPTTPPKSSRSLTVEEIALAKSVFGNTIRYHEVKVFNDTYIPSQKEGVIMAPNGNLYPEKAAYRENYALSEEEKKHLFIHEMGHVWQYHSGVSVKLLGAITHSRAMIDGKNPYLYNIHQSFGMKTVKITGADGNSVTNIIKLESKLSDYNLEAQAEIIADYWALKNKKDLSLLMFKENFHTNIFGRNLDDILRIYERKVKEALGF